MFSAVFVNGNTFDFNGCICTIWVLFLYQFLDYSFPRLLLFIVDYRCFVVVEVKSFDVLPFLIIIICILPFKWILPRHLNTHRHSRILGCSLQITLLLMLTIRYSTLSDQLLLLTIMNNVITLLSTNNNIIPIAIILALDNLLRVIRISVLFLNDVVYVKLFVLLRETTV